MGYYRYIPKQHRWQSTGVKRASVVKTFELVDVKTGRTLFSGTKERCLGHLLNDAMTLVLSSTAATEYRRMMK